MLAVVQVVYWPDLWAVFVQVAQMVVWFCANCTMCSGREWMRFVQHAQMEMCFCATCTKKG